MVCSCCRLLVLAVLSELVCFPGEGNRMLWGLLHLVGVREVGKQLNLVLGGIGLVCLLVEL